jgi:hypothetical protein
MYTFCVTAKLQNHTGNDIVGDGAEFLNSFPRPNLGMRAYFSQRGNA